MKVRESIQWMAIGSVFGTTMAHYVDPATSALISIVILGLAYLIPKKL